MQQPISVTFDTNTFRPLVEAHKRVESDIQAFEKIDKAIKDRQITPYLSDAIVVLEGVPRKERAKFFDTSLITEIQPSPIPGQMPNGTPVHQINVKLNVQYGAPLQLDERLLEALRSGIKLGFKFMHLPRVALPLVNEKELYKPVLATEFDEMSKRFNSALLAFEDKGFGSSHVHNLAKESADREPELEGKGMMAFANNKPSRVRDAVSEWADGDALATHYGYGHDVFCTYDEGKKDGIASVLHRSHRPWLASKFGIKIMTPTELAEEISARFPR